MAEPAHKFGTRFGEGGRYEIREQIGRGGMAVVYKVVDTQLNNRLFAVKLLALPEESNPTEDRQRGLEKLRSLFLEESQALSRVRDNNVVAVITNGRMPDANETPYMVMEHLTGVDLRRLLKNEKQLSVERSCDIILAVSAGVHACHAANVIHRDLKPANIFLDQTLKGEEPKVLDFSVAKVPASRDQTKTDFVIGTTDYMSPEQKRGKPANEQSDQYSIGALLYFCLVGEPPMALVKPREVRPDIPEGLEAALLRAMDINPDRRFASVHELGKSLLPFATSVGRAKWKHYYTTPPLAMRPAFTGPLSVPRGAHASEIAPTRVEAYDFRSHDRTTRLTSDSDSLALPTIVDGSSANDTSRPPAPPTLETEPPTELDAPAAPSSVARPSTEERYALAPTVPAQDESSGASRPAPALSRRRRLILVATVSAVSLFFLVVLGLRRSSSPEVVPATAPAWTRSGPAPAPPPSAERLPTPVAPVPSIVPATPTRAPAPPRALPADQVPAQTPPAQKKRHRSRPPAIQYRDDGIPLVH